MKELPCEIVQDLMPSYIDELTSPVTNEAVRTHLEECPDCRAYWERMTHETKTVPEPNPDISAWIRKTARQRKRRAFLGGILEFLTGIALYLLLRPYSTVTVKTYHGVWQRNGRDYPATAILNLREDMYLLKRDTVEGSLQVFSEAGNPIFDLILRHSDWAESEDPLPMTVVDDQQTYTLVGEDYWTFATPFHHVTAAVDASMDLLYLHIDEVNGSIKLVSGDHQLEEVEAMFMP